MVAVASCSINQYVLADCEASFPDGVSSHSATGVITFGNNTTLKDSPDGVLEAATVNSGSGNSCDTQAADCTASGTPVSVIDPGTFEATSSSDTYSTSSDPIPLGQSGTTEYATVTVTTANALEFSTSYTEYHFTNLTVNNNAVVKLRDGDYWIESLNIGNTVEFSFEDTGTARVFVKNTASIPKEFKLNGGDDSNKVVFYSYGDLDIAKDADIAAFIYVAGDFTLAKDSVIKGGVTAADIIFAKDSEITYESSKLNNVDFGSMCAVDSGATYFKITHDSYGLTCANESITVEARANDDSVVTDYSNQITLNTGTSNGTWYVQGNPTALNPDNGIANYTFTGSESGNVIFELFYDESGVLDNVSDLEVEETSNSSVRDDDSEADLTFSEQGFLLTSTLYTDGGSITFSNQTAGTTTSDVYITAYGDTGVSGCGIIEEYTGSKNLKLWVDYDNPTTGTLTPLIDSVTIANSLGSASNRSITFTSGQTGALDFKYKDVGQITLNARDESGLPNVDIQGSSPNFIVSPSTFVISNVISASSTANPAASDDSGNVFAEAGEGFTLTVEAHDAEGSVTPNYGNETSAEGVEIIRSLVAPTGGANPALTGDYNLTTASSGVFTVDSGDPIIWNEVGIISIYGEVNDGDYLGAGNVIGGSVNVGRFVPERLGLAVNTPDILNNSSTSACNFTYQDTGITFDTDPVFTVTGLKVDDTQALNYFDAGASEDFWKLATTLSNRVYIDENANGGTLAANLTAPSFSGGNSSGTAGVYTLTSDELTYQRDNVAPNASDVPFDASMQLTLTAADLTDSDSVCYDPDDNDTCDLLDVTGIVGDIASGAVNVRYGRVVVDNAHGSELLALQVPVKAEHWTAAGFTTNTLDSCSSLVLGDSQITATVNDPVSSTLTGGDTTLTAWSGFASGAGTLTLSAPGSGKTGYVDLLSDVTTNFSWLQYDFDGGGGLDDDPTGRATFGIYQGDDVKIFWRQSYR